MGTSTSKEAKEYFSEMEKHRITFRYSGAEDDAAITLVSLTQIHPSTPPSLHPWVQPLTVQLWDVQAWNLRLFLFQAFSKKKTDDRKEWLTNFMEDRRQRRMHGLPEVGDLAHEEALMCVRAGFPLSNLLLFLSNTCTAARPDISPTTTSSTKS